MGNPEAGFQSLIFSFGDSLGSISESSSSTVPSSNTDERPKDTAGGRGNDNEDLNDTPSTAKFRVTSEMGVAMAKRISAK